MRDSAQSGSTASSQDVKLLVQLQPNTTAQVLYTPPAGKKAILTHLWIAVYDNDVKVNLNHDVGGSTWDKSNAWMNEVKIKKDSVIVSLPLGNVRLNFSDTIGVEIDKSQDATFSLYGYEEDI